MLKASLYIADMLSNSSSIKWTLLSHLYMPVSIFLKEQLQNECICYYQDPDYMLITEFSSNKPKLKSCIAVEKDIKEIDSNEMIILRNRLNHPEDSFDKKFILLAFIPSIRNLVRDITKDLNYLCYGKYADIYSELGIIQKKYLHFGRGCLININQLVEIYIGIYGNLKFFDYVVEDNNSIIDERKKILEVNFANVEGDNILLKVILNKMLWMSYLRYSYEEAIAKVMINNGFTDSLNKKNGAYHFMESATTGEKKIRL